MKLQTLRTCLEQLSFFVWIAFTIFSIALAGLGIEGTIVATFVFLFSHTQPIHFPLGMLLGGCISFFLSIFWRQVGIDHFHYLLYDSISSSPEETDESMILKNLILKVESAAGFARNDARAEAKIWLLDHVSSLTEDDIQLAKTHFGYMLPAKWGSSSKRI